MTELDTTTPPDDQAPAAPVSTDTEAPAPIVPPEEAPDVEPVPDLEPAPEPAPLGAEPPATEEDAPEVAPESPEVVAVPEPAIVGSLLCGLGVLAFRRAARGRRLPSKPARIQPSL